MAITAGDVLAAQTASAAIQAGNGVCAVVKQVTTAQMKLVAAEQAITRAAVQGQQVIDMLAAAAGNPGIAAAYVADVAEASAQALLDKAYNDAMTSIANQCPANG